MAGKHQLTFEITAECDNEKQQQQQQPATREFWSDRFAFLLTIMGYNIGLAIMLRFPYLVMKNGGGAFLIPYFVFLVTIGIPLFMLELPLGQYSGKSAVKFFKSFCPLLTGIGWSNVILCFFFNIYYLVLMSWICYYLVHSFFNPLPWSGCNPGWNSSSCHWVNLTAANSTDNYAADMSLEQLRSDNCSAFETDRRSPTELFFERNLLGLTSGIHDLGEIRWELVLCLAASWICIYLCLVKGVQSLGKVVYVTALGPFVFLLILLVRGLTLPGGKLGVLYYLTPDWERLATPAPWVEAAQQIFWSLGPTWGCTICMASHNRFRNNIYRDSLLLPLVCAFTSFFAGFVTFSFVGDLAVRTGRPIPCVLKAGLSLAFVVYLTAFESLPLPQLWAIVFFMLLMLLALNSAFSTFQTMYMSIAEVYPDLLLKRAWASKLFMCFVSLLIGLPMMTQGGYYIYTLVDWYQCAFVMVIAFLEVVCMAYAYGSRRIRANICLMTGVRMTIFWDVVWGGFLPIILMVLFVFTIKDYRPPNYGEYEYPKFAVVCSWLFACCCLVPLPVLMLYTIIRERVKSSTEPQPSLLTTLKQLLSPSKDWESVRNQSLRSDPELRERLVDISQKLGPEGSEMSPLNPAPTG